MSACSNGLNGCILYPNSFRICINRNDNGIRMNVNSDVAHTVVNHEANTHAKMVDEEVRAHIQMLI